MKQWTKNELSLALAGKEKSKTFAQVQALPNNFKGAMPKEIANGIVKMKNVNADVYNCAKNTKEGKRDITSAKKPENIRRRTSNEY